MARNRVTIEKMEPWHLEVVAENCREMDRREIYLTCLLRPKQALELTAQEAVASWCALLDGKPVAVFGVNYLSHLDNTGVPWFVATDDIVKCRIQALKLSRKYFDRMARAFRVMENYVWVENTVAVHWLKWMGFDMGEPEIYGAGRVPFMKFSKG